MATAISMAYVSPAVIAKRKTETRRHWTPEYARRFKKGDILDAYSHAPRYGGVKVATLRLTANPFRERMSVHNTVEKFMRIYEAEGFAYMDEPEEGFPLVDLMRKWIELDEELWVVPFEIISVEAGMMEKFCTKPKIKQKREKLIDALLGEDMRDDLMQPSTPKAGDVQKSVQDAVMGEVVKKTMEQELPKCDWCGKDAVKTFPFRADKRIYNICPECKRLPDEMRWGEVAGYLKHIPIEDGKRIDEEEAVKPKEEPIVVPKPPAPEPIKKTEKEIAKGFWTCNGCGAVVPDDMACNICHYTREKSMREIEEAKREEEERLKSMGIIKGGADTLESEEEEAQSCPSCGGKIIYDQCGDCGAKVVSEDELEEGQIVCTDCSCVLEADETECPECGKSRVEIEVENEEEGE